MAIITDRDAYIAVSGTGRKAFLGKSLPEEVTEAMETRQPYTSETAGTRLPIQGFEDANQLLVPIIHEGEVVGSVILLSKEKSLGNLEITSVPNGCRFPRQTAGVISRLHGSAVEAAGRYCRPPPAIFPVTDAALWCIQFP